MTFFAVDNNAQLVDAVNYAISNLAGAGLQADLGTGQITAPGDPTVVGYLYQYINVRYANNSTGTVDFSSSPTNRDYYGLRNSTASAGSNNPADYVWYRVTGGFGTTTFLFYSAIGGRQIVFDPDTTAPNPNFQQVQDGVAIDLDAITVVGATGPQGPTGPVGPSGPSGPQGDRYATTSTTSLSIGTGTQTLTVETGLAYTTSQSVLISHDASNDMTGTVTSYDAGTGVLVVDVTSVNGSGTYASWEINITGAVGVPGATGPQGPQGATGPQGPTGPATRGPIPLAFILTPSTPIGANVATLNSWFSSARTNVVPPIGTGQTPIADDTAQFYYQAGDAGIVLEYDGSAWQNVVGQVIDGNLVVTGTVKADQIAANAVTTAKLNANAVTADKIDANAVTTAKLNASAVTADKIDANAVTAVKIAANAVTSDKIIANAITTAKIDANAVTANKLSATDIYAVNIKSDNANFPNILSNGYWLQASTGSARFGGSVSIGNNLTVGSNANIGANLNVAGIITAGSLIANTVATTTVVPQAISQAVVIVNTSSEYVSPTSGFELPITSSYTVNYASGDYVIYIPTSYSVRFETISNTGVNVLAQVRIKETYLATTNTVWTQTAQQRTSGTNSTIEFAFSSAGLARTQAQGLVPGANYSYRAYVFPTWSAGTVGRILVTTYWTIQLLKR